MLYFDTRKELVESLISPHTRGAKLGTTCLDFNHTLAGLKPSTLYLVDDWDTKHAFHTETFDAMTEIRHEEVLKSFWDNPNVTIEKQNPEAFIDSYSEDSFDWIYLDMDLRVRGGYSYRDGRGVETDILIRKCCDKLKPGGILMGSHGDSITSRRCLGIYFQRTDNNYLAFSHEESNHNMTWAFRKGDHPRLKIKVMQFATGNEPHYDLSEKINRYYCAKHEYEYVRVKEFPERRHTHDRHPTWEKVTCVADHLHHCDFLFYIDADAFFYGLEFKIETLTYDMCPFAVMRCPVDKFDEYTTQGTEHQCNTGSFLVCNSPRAHAFMERWNRTSDEMEDARFGKQNEQEGLLRLSETTHPHWNFREENYYLMGGANGLFVRHLAGCRNEERIDKMEAFIASRRIV